MKGHFILLFTLAFAVRLKKVSSATTLPNVCEQLRSDPSVGILSLVTVPIRRQLLILTTNFFAVEVDFYRRFTYPSWAGYPHFLPLHFKEKWTVEITADDDTVFDVLSTEERRQWRAARFHSASNRSVVKVTTPPPPPTGLLIHNGSTSSTYYVTVTGEEEGPTGRRLLWRAVDRGRGVERRVVSGDQPVEDRTLCVSAQESSRGYSVAVAADGASCFTRTDFYAGSTDQHIRVVRYASSGKCSSSAAVPLCGALINELLFAVNNTAKTLSIYPDPLLGGRTARIQTVPFAEFFACSPASNSIELVFLLIVCFLTVIAAWGCVMLCCWWCRRRREAARAAKSRERQRWNRRWRRRERTYSCY